MPAKQLTQMMAPVVATYVPAAQVLQLDEPRDPAYVPARQLAHPLDPAAEYAPVAQFVQARAKAGE